MILKGTNHNFAIIHYWSWKWATRHLFGSWSRSIPFRHSLDFFPVHGDHLSSMLRWKVSTVPFRDSKILFDKITPRLRTAARERVLIDTAANREHYSNKDLTNVAHVVSQHSLANGSIKPRADTAMLRGVMAGERPGHPNNQWILSWVISHSLKWALQ